MATRGARKEPDAESLLSARRTLAALEALAARPDGTTPKALSQILGVHLSTCYRLLNTLVVGGYVTRDPGDGLFRLGSRVAYLNHGYLAAQRPPPEALPFVHALQLATGETAMLAHLEWDNLIFTAAVAGSLPGAHPPGYVGFAIPAHTLAAGRVLLAWLPTAEREAHLARLATVSASPFPIPDPGALREELKRIRVAGYALDRGDMHPDVCCVAAPVGGRTGAVGAAIAVVAPCTRFAREEPALIAAVLAVARAIGALHIATRSHDKRVDADQRGPEAATPAAIEAAQAAVAEAMSRVG